MKKIPPALIVIFFAAFAVFAAFRALRTDDPKPVTAPLEEFSSGRAMEKLKVIAAQPHPSGFVANRFVKDYLVTELKNAGLDPFLRPAVVERNGNTHYIENIIAVKRGTGGPSAGKLLISAHYDARGDAPGAGDNGAAVAAVLETIRALDRYQPLINDVVFFFPDGEELGSLGARSFVTSDPHADSIDLVLNFDGRGTSGTSLMFETSKGNYDLIKNYNKAGGSSYASSLSDEVYHMISYYTDFTWFLKKIPAGLNFAHVGSVQNYHTGNDDIFHLDQGTLQSHGNSMLASILHFGNISLKNNDSREAVYFHLILPGLIIYPSTAVVPLAIMAFIFFIVVFYFGIKNDQMDWMKILAVAGLYLLKIVIAAIAVHFTWKTIGPSMKGFGQYEMDWVPAGDYILGGFLAAVLVLFLLFQGKINNKYGAVNTVTGTMLVWLLLIVATSLYFKGGSYLFLWPFILSLIPLLVFIMKKKTEHHGILLLAMVFSTPGIYLFTQVIYLFYQTMTLQMAGAIAAMFIIMLGLLQLPVSISKLVRS